MAHEKRRKGWAQIKKKWGTPTLCENSPNYEIINQVHAFSGRVQKMLIMWSLTSFGQSKPFAAKSAASLSPSAIAQATKEIKLLTVVVSICD